MRKGYIVFDLDGTLVSTHKAAFSAIQTIISEVRKEHISLKEVKDKFIPDIKKLYLNFGIDFNNLIVKKRVTDRWMELFESPNFSYNLFPGIRCLLTKLKEAKYGLYVWTGGYRQYALKILNQTGIINFFEKVCCADDTDPKPDTEGVIKLVGDVPKEKVVIIGDSVTDIQGAKNFGCNCIVALWDDYVKINDLKKMQPDFWADYPEDCMQIIEEII